MFPLMSFDFKLIQEPHKFLAWVVLWELLSFLIGQGDSKFWLQSPWID
jgi:hypothetical protein